MQLSKTDFKYYLDCPESLWLKKNKPDKYNGGEFTLFEEKLASEGYEFENYVKILNSLITWKRLDIILKELALAPAQTALQEVSQPALDQLSLSRKQLKPKRSLKVRNE